MARRGNSRQRAAAKVHRSEDHPDQQYFLLRYWFKELDGIILRGTKNPDDLKKLEDKRDRLIVKISAFGSKANRPSTFDPELDQRVRDILLYRRGLALEQQKKTDPVAHQRRYYQTKEFLTIKLHQ